MLPVCYEKVHKMEEIHSFLVSASMEETVRVQCQKQVHQLQCQEQCVDNIPYYLLGLSRALFSDNFSRNSHIYTVLFKMM